NDVAVANLVVPASGGAIAASTTFTPTAIVRNVGTGSQTSLSVTFTIRDSVGTQVYTSTQTVASLASGATATVAFASTSISTVNRYSARAAIALTGDSY